MRRQREEDEYRNAVHDLVLFSPDRPTLARRAAEWGLRLVGADGIAIVDANGEILALRGLPREVAHRLAAQGDPKGRPRLLATQGSSREDAIVVPLPLDLGTGAIVIVSGPYTPFFGTDEVSRLRGYAANLTAALDRARVTERLAALEKTKTQFLNLASHELRSPLGVINGYLSMLEQGSLGKLDEAGLRAVDVLKAKTAELNVLVAQMLDSARLEDGRLALKRDRIDLRDVAGDAMQVVRPLAGPNHVLTLETPPVPVTVLGDADRIKTIISNLLENAIKYSPNGGRVLCIVSTADAVAILRVVDDGVGIARYPRRVAPAFRQHVRAYSSAGRHGSDRKRADPERTRTGRAATSCRGLRSRHRLGVAPGLAHRTQLLKRLAHLVEVKAVVPGKHAEHQVVALWSSLGVHRDPLAMHR